MELNMKATCIYVFDDKTKLNTFTFEEFIEKANKGFISYKDVNCSSALFRRLAVGWQTKTPNCVFVITNTVLAEEEKLQFANRFRNEHSSVHYSSSKIQ